MEQMELNFRRRDESGCRRTMSKEGCFSPKINKATTARLLAYCSRVNINKTKFVEKCVNECLDKLEEEYYESLDKSELIRLLREKK